jgi:flavin reductase ActVB
VTNSENLKEALARFASGVTITTTAGADGSNPVGFTASAFSALSLDPPLVLVCLSNSARCHSAFASATRMGISVLSEDQADIATRFATRNADKFIDGLVCSPRGIPLVSSAHATFECELVEVIPRGDHSILLGKVEEVTWTVSRPLVYWNRQFTGCG